MKKIKNLIVIVLATAMLLGSTLTVYAQTQTFYGGRRDITLGDHNSTIRVFATAEQVTRVQMWDKNWNSVWAESFQGDYLFECGPDVYTITFYLDSNKKCTVTW